MKTGLAETQFSIYKVDFDAVDEHFKINVERDDARYLKKVLDALVNSTCAIIMKKPYSMLQRVQYKGFYGVFFKTYHDPDWKMVAEQIICNNELEKTEMGPELLVNTNVSYVLLYSVDSKLYACTGGYGSNYISKFTLKNYGLSLIPKLIDRNNPVVKNVIQNNLIGNQASTNKVNRKTTSLSIEQDMSSVFRQLILELNRSIVEKMGVVFDKDESDSKKTSLINKDSIIVRRSLSLSELVTVLNQLSKVEEKKDAFALNYLVLARKKNIKNADLFERLVNDFAKGEYSRFVLVGDEYEQYYANASRYILIDETGRIRLDKTEPIDLQDVISVINSQGKEPSKASIKTMLKHWQISTENNAGETVLFPLDVFNALQGFVEYGNNNAPCYLFNGSWFVFDKQYETILSKQFSDLYDYNKPLAEGVIKKWKLTHASPSEEEYNKWLSKHTNVQVSHRVSKGNIEIADAIFYDEGTIYLMHNKDSFSGSGARDLTNQILASSESVAIHRGAFDAASYFEDYYNKIAETAKKKDRNIAIGKQEFIDMFRNAKKICYIAGYLKNYRKDSKSTYAKYLSIELQQKLKRKGFDLLLIGLEDE